VSLFILVYTWGEKQAFLRTKLAIGLRNDKWHHSKKWNGRKETN